MNHPLGLLVASCIVILLSNCSSSESRKSTVRVRQRPIKVEAISYLDGKLIIDSCTREETIVNCRVHASTNLTGHRISGSARRWDESTWNFVALPGTLVSAPNMVPGLQAELEMIVPEEADTVYLTYD